MTVIVMGMTFDSESVPDFGSIRMTAQRHNNVNDYIVLSADISKLDGITNAAEGSTAICVDTADLYILLMGEWLKFGEENTESTGQTQSVNLSPVDISREELTGSSGLNEPEISDSLTVEPIAENLTDDTDDTSSEELTGSSGLNEPEISDSLTVEPIAENLTDDTDDTSSEELR